VLGDQCTERFATITSSAFLRPKQVLFVEREPAACHYTIISGVLSISKFVSDGRRQIIGFLFPGDFVGIAVHDRYSCTAQAVTSAELCRIPHEPFMALASEFPELKHRLLEVVSNELGEAQCHMLMLGRKNAEERLASFLLDLSRRAPLRGEADNPVELPMTRGDISDYLGLTLETVSRTFGAMRDRGLIAFNDTRMVRLTAMEQLQALVEATPDPA
jgi:CRP/FNR family transcriptional regulator